MTNETLLIRADASIAIGTGHVMRCLALAQAWQDAGGRAVFAAAEVTLAVRTRLEAEGCEVISIPSAGEDDARTTAKLARAKEVGWVVVDGYQFGEDYQRALKEAGFKVLFLDDYGHASPYCADVILNQNIGVGADLYAKRQPQTQLLLGPRYGLLRREFSAWRKWKRKIRPVVERVLVTMGGSDPKEVTARVIEAMCLPEFKAVESIVVAGGSNSRLDLLEEQVRQANQRYEARITLQKEISNMPEIMAWADVSISAAGTTCLELCLLGVPSLLIDVAPNQTAPAKELARLGCAVHIGDAGGASVEKVAVGLEQLMRSEDRRRSLSETAQTLVDGCGARRVVSVLRGGNEIYMRRAVASDATLLWKWANDPDVRAASFSSAYIPWATHVTWFEEKLRISHCLILIAEDEEGIPVGQIRFDPRDDGGADVNITIAKERRGRRLAVALIAAGMREQFANNGGERVHAFVKPGNTVSVRAFEKAGFVRAETAQVRGNAALHFVYTRQVYACH